MHNIDEELIPASSHSLYILINKEADSANIKI